MPSPRSSLRLLAGVGLLSTALLAGCGDDEVVDRSPTDLADALGCAADFEEIEAPAGVQDAGSCVLQVVDSDESVQLLSFADEAAREDYVQQAVVAGAVFVTEGAWAVEVESEEAASLVQEAVGGETELDDES